MPERADVAAALAPRLWTTDRFMQFYMGRPDGERWQLVEGLAMMVAPPTRVHQRILANLSYALDASLTLHWPTEVVDRSNPCEMIDRKLELYRSHPDNLCALTIDQDSVHVTLFARETGRARIDLHKLDDILRLPAFGFAATVAQIYAGTPLGR